MVKDKDEQQRYLMTDNSALFFELRGAVVTAEAWEQGKGGRWPSTDLTTSSQKVRPTALIGPEPGGKTPLSDQALLEWQARVADYMVRHLDDLNADILDAIIQLWLQRCPSPEQMTVIRADDLLRFRGLQPRGRSFWTEQREKIAERMALLSSTWIDLHEMETIVQDKHGRRKTKVQKIRSRAIVISSVAEETTQEGTTVCAWKVRPGDVFAPFLLGPGKQLAMLSQRVLEYDFYRHAWEKRIARYLYWLARIRQGKGEYLKPVRVRSILEAIKKEVDERNPKRTRERFETAMARLTGDQVIRGWSYDESDQPHANRAWLPVWLETRVLVELPQPVLDQYQKIALPPATLDDPKVINIEASEVRPQLILVMKNHRLTLRMTQQQLAKVLGVHPNYLAQLERGVKRPSEELQQAIQGWLTGSIPPGDSESPD